MSLVLTSPGWADASASLPSAFSTTRRRFPPAVQLQI